MPAGSKKIAFSFPFSTSNIMAEEASFTMNSKLETVCVQPSESKISGGLIASVMNYQFLMPTPAVRPCIGLHLVLNFWRSRCSEFEQLCAPPPRPRRTTSIKTLGIHMQNGPGSRIQRRPFAVRPDSGASTIQDGPFGIFATTGTATADLRMNG